MECNPATLARFVVRIHTGLFPSGDRILDTQSLADNEIRPTLDLFVNQTDIDTNDPEKTEENAEKHDHQSDDGPESGERDATSDPVDRQCYQRQNSRPKKTGPDQRNHDKRQLRMSEDSFDGELQNGNGVRLRSACEPLFTLVFHPYRAKSHPGNQASNKAIALVHAADDFVNPAVEETEVTGVGRNQMAGQFPMIQ